MMKTLQEIDGDDLTKLTVSASNGEPMLDMAKLSFPEKPSEEDRQFLKDLGWTWNRRQGWTPSLGGDYKSEVEAIIDRFDPHIAIQPKRGPKSAETVTEYFDGPFVMGYLGAHVELPAGFELDENTFEAVMDQVGQMT